jgi:hypothetical protein
MYELQGYESSNYIKVCGEKWNNEKLLKALFWHSDRGDEGEH